MGKKAGLEFNNDFIQSYFVVITKNAVPVTIRIKCK